VLKPALIGSLPDLPSPLLTVYLDTDQAKPANRGFEPGYVASFEDRVKQLAETVPSEDRSLFRELAKRVGTFLQTEPLHSAGLVIFAGRDTWEIAPVQAAVEDELHWGAPALAQLLWLIDEHRPYGIVVVGRQRVRFFYCWLGEMLELEEREFRMEPTKEKEMGKVSRPPLVGWQPDKRKQAVAGPDVPAAGVRMSRGTNRDVFDHHWIAEYARYHRQIAAEIERWCAAEPLDSVFLVGLDEMVKGIEKNLPEVLRPRAVLVEEDLGWLTRPELHKRLEPIVARHNAARELSLVETLLGSDRGVVTGVDETVVRLQQGRIRALVVAKGLDCGLHQCVTCSWADGSSDPRCPACGGERRSVRLRDILPELARRNSTSLEVVSGEALRRLEPVGGMAAWLRELERKEYAQAALP